MDRDEVEVHKLAKKKNEANIQPSSPHTWSITHTYISLPSSAKQERQITKFCVAWETRKTKANFPYSYLEVSAVRHWSTFPEPLASWKDLANCEFRWWNKFIFDYASSSPEGGTFNHEDIDVYFWVLRRFPPEQRVPNSRFALRIKP